MDRVVMVGKIYRHYKGGDYKILCIARDSESKTGEEIVVYEALYGDHIVWARPYDMFNAFVDKEKYPNCSQEYRFELVVE